MELIEERRKILFNTPHIQTSTSNNFSTDIIAPLKGLEIELEPIQSGTGTPAPDNVRPISGRTQISVRHFGKNLFDFSEPFRTSGLYYGKGVGTPIERGSSTNVTTEVNNNIITVTTKAGWQGVCYRSIDIPNGTYTLSFNINLTNWTGSQNGRDIYVVDKNNIITRVIMHTTGLVNTTSTITLTGDESAIAISLGGRSSTYGTFEIVNLQLEVGGNKTTYEPFIQSGVNSITFPALGKNLYDCAEFSSYKQADGTYRLTGANATNAKVYFPEELVGKEIVLSVYLDLTKETGPTYIRLRAVVDGTNKNGATIYDNNAGYSTVTVTPTSTSDYFYMTYGSNGGNYYTFSQFQVEIKTGSSRTSYEPYTNTVYGGTLDLVTGVLTITHNIVVIDGSENPAIFPWQSNNVASGWIKALYRRLPYENIHPNYHITPVGYYCDKAKPMTIPELRTLSEYGFGAYDNNSYGIILLMKIEDVGNTLESLNAYLTQNPFTIVYPLLNPVVYQLTPVQIKALLNGNTFLTDDGKIVKVNYWKHMK